MDKCKKIDIALLSGSLSALLIYCSEKDTAISIILFALMYSLTMFLLDLN